MNDPKDSSHGACNECHRTFFSHRRVVWTAHVGFLEIITGKKHISKRCFILITWGIYGKLGRLIFWRSYLSIDCPGNLNNQLGMDFVQFLMVKSRPYEPGFKIGVREMVTAGLWIKLLKYSTSSATNQGIKVVLLTCLSPKPNIFFWETQRCNNMFGQLHWLYQQISRQNYS